MNGGLLFMCASSDHASHWDQIDWCQCRPPRPEAASAYRKGDTGKPHWGKVKTLQWLLTHSFSGQALAVKRVTDNQGKNTPGVDRVTWRTPAAKN